eukprot:Nk52_evm30s294 gene=Nk52_evmTU30s294
MSSATTCTPVDALSSYTCINCRVQFQNCDVQRAHYKTDWHRYNLKRKVAGLAPVSAENFKERLEVQKQDVEKKQELQEYTTSCTICKKNYSSENAYNTHIQSKKHKEKALKHAASKKDEADSGAKGSDANGKKQTAKTEGSKPSLASLVNETGKDLEELYLEKAVNLGLEDCIFCSKKSASFDANLAHMTQAHSFFIPDVEYLVDAEGLIKYLGEKVSVGNLCLYCNEKGKAFQSLEAVRKHMSDKGHCKLETEDDAYLEYSEYYDFSTSYPDYVEGEDMDMEAEADKGALTIDDDAALVLPDGSKLGHRVNKKFYKQSLKPEDHRKAVVIAKLSEQYRVMGYHQHQHVFNTVAMKDLQRFQRKEAHNNLRVGYKSNNQEFFRLQNPM